MASPGHAAAAALARTAPAPPPHHSPPRPGDVIETARPAAGPEPSSLATQLSRGLEALHAGADFDLVERALRDEAAAAAEAEAAAEAALARMGL